MSQSDTEAIHALLTQAYTNDQPRLSAILLRLLGSANLQLVEDIIQDAFEKAQINWLRQGIPQNPSAWLITTAKNAAFDTLRKQKTHKKYAKSLLPTLTSNWTMASKINHTFTQLYDVKDEQLNIMAWLCSSSLKTEYLLPVMLKMVCGMSVDSIGRALLINKNNAQKRINRALQKLKSHDFSADNVNSTKFTPSDLSDVKSKIHLSLYLLFNEGLSAHRNNNLDDAILCIEALNIVLTMHKSETLGGNDTDSLLTLMYFYLARQAGRVDENGEIIPLNIQDRTRWKNHYLYKAIQHLALILNDGNLHPNVYIYEALIANEHMLASDFTTTNWNAIAGFYRHWLSVHPSPMIELNLAVVLAHLADFDGALNILRSCEDHKVVVSTHQLNATYSYVYALMGKCDKAQQYINTAEQLGMNERELRALKKQVQCLTN